MTTFHGSVRLEADPGTSVRAMVDVGQDEVVLIAGDVELGRWPRATITVRQVGDTFVMRADDERLILAMDETAAFGAAMSADEDAAVPEDDAENGAAPEDGVGEDVDSVESEHAPAEEEIAPSDADESVFTETPETMVRLRKASAATYSDDNVLRTWIGLTLAATGLALGVGAALTWGGHARLLSDGFPLARVLAGLAAAAALAGAYLGVFSEQRRLGGIIAATGSAGALVVLYLAAREAGLGIGFLLAIVGALGAMTVGIAAVLDGAAAPSQRSDS